MARIVTSSAGSKLRTQGFTLLELLVVLALAAILMAVAPPLLKNALPGVELKATARQLAAGLRYARNHAIFTRQQTLLTMDLTKREFTVSGRKKSYAVPDGIEIELFTAVVETESETKGSIRFFPAGGSTGGRITVSNKKRQMQVDVDWLTGKVRILEPNS